MPIDPPSIAAGTILVVAATLIGALIGAVIPDRMRTRSERKHLRVALKTEIEHITYHNWDTDYFKGERPHIASTTVFEGNADQIGLLSEEEAEAIISLYSELKNFEALIQNPDGQLTTRSIEEAKASANSLRKDALEAIEEELMNR